MTRLEVVDEVIQFMERTGYAPKKMAKCKCGTTRTRELYYTIICGKCGGRIPSYISIARRVK